MSRRSWVQIPATYTGWTFFTYICCKYFCLKRPNINDKRGRVGPFKKQLMITGFEPGSSGIDSDLSANCLW